MENLHFAILIVAIIIIIYWHSTRENLQCSCARNEKVVKIWNDMAPGEADISPIGSINPFFLPYSASRPFGMSTQYIDVPISRMVGDHVPLE